jgi:hypothetical protein
MAKRRVQKDWLDKTSGWLAHNKGLPVFAGAGLVLVNLALRLLPSLPEAGGLLGWLAHTDLLLHLGVVVALLGILVGDAL